MNKIAEKRHIRTMNPIESMFATVCHRTRQRMGCGSCTAMLTMGFKLVVQPEQQKIFPTRLLAIFPLKG